MIRKVEILYRSVFKQSQLANYERFKKSMSIPHLVPDDDNWFISISGTSTVRTSYFNRMQGGSSSFSYDSYYQIEAGNFLFRKTKTTLVAFIILLCDQVRTARGNVPSATEKINNPLRSRG
mmetsp:Transcript_11939/g.18018  ORF Transcript_11939/g.18018 Transcript_11939/m.18018 type:complete len:121 (+) Transcript_11939:144-506(+)